MQKRIVVLATVAGCLLLLPLVAKNMFAQAVTGALLGTVVDATGAVVPSVSVTLTNEGTNVTNKTTTSAQGFYTFPNLSPGQYSVSVEAQGFKKLISKHNIVQVEQTTRADMTLTPGAVTAEVTVTGTTTLPLTTTPAGSGNVGLTIQ